MVEKTSTKAPATLESIDLRAARKALKQLRDKYEADCKPYRVAILKAKLKEVQKSE